MKTRRTFEPKTSKSPNAVAAEALAVGQQVFRAYSHKFSPKKFTQPQLFACLVLKTFFKTDYRGIRQILRDSSDLRENLQLQGVVPHWTTLQKASDRLLRLPKARQVLSRTIRRSTGRRKRVKQAAIDSSGYDCGHASRYYVQRRAKGQDKQEKPQQKTTYRRYIKQELVLACDDHLILAVSATLGPRPDVDRLVPLLDATLEQVTLEKLYGDGGFDSEPNHRYAREHRGVRSYIPAQIGRPTAKPPSGYWRRQMKRRLRSKRLRRRYGYGQRWQAECGFSMIKRRLSTFVAARTYWRQVRELWLLALTHNILILYAPAGFSTQHF